jgi:DNA polymerase
MPNYVRSILRPGSKIFLVGEMPGEEEDRMAIPFVGKNGKMLNQLLEQAGINRAEVSLANVARERPPGNKVSFFFEDTRCTTPKPIMQKWIEELKKEISEVNPNIVVALGATPMFALIGEKGIQEHRGYIQYSSLVPGKKVITTWSPQKVGFEWKLGFETVMDLRKAKNNSLTPYIAPDRRSLYA